MSFTPDEAAEIAKYMAEIDQLVKQKAKILRYHKKWTFQPYLKQQEFYDLGLTCRERLLRAGNQLGKTEAGAFEIACHLTGEYPDWWMGQRYKRPIRAWAAAAGATLTRDGVQTKLCGKPGDADSFGTGMIPLKAFKGTPSAGRGATFAFDTIFVEHRTNGVVDGVSSLTFKSFEQGADKFQSEPVDVIWLDEEAPWAIYSECFTRGNAIPDSMIYTTFTPLWGRTELVVHFLDEPDPQRGEVCMTIDDCPHMTPEVLARNMGGYKKHELDARLRGIPMLGSGAIFPYPRESLECPPMRFIPPYWPKLWGIDFGIAHPFAAALCAWDRDSDVFYVTAGVRMKDGGPLQHAKAMKAIDPDAPVAWPQDGYQRDKGGDNKALAMQYKAEGLRMMEKHAHWPDGSNSTEAGIMEMQERMETARFKVYPHLTEWWDEFSGYHRKEGVIVKVRDDLLSATRTAVMMKRFGKAGTEGPWRRPGVATGNVVPQADGVEFDLF
jgi:phage terminase large subunit-like protein